MSITGNSIDFAISKRALAFTATKTTVFVEIVIGLNCSSCIDNFIVAVRTLKCDIIHKDSLKKGVTHISARG